MHRSPWRPTARGLVGGEAEPAGVAEACRNEDLEVLDEGGGGGRWRVTGRGLGSLPDLPGHQLDLEPVEVLK